MKLVNVLCLMISLGAVGMSVTACQLFTGETILPAQQPSDQNAPWYQVYFSEPANPQAETKRGGPDQYLADAIHQAQLSVDVATYDLDLWSIRDALIDAHRRGVEVRVVVDSDNLERREVEALKEAGIPVLGDRREGLMHNKFVVIDRQDVWTGSMNLTINSAYRNNDNLLFIRSPELAENYLTEFEEMYLLDRFGPDTLRKTPHPSLLVQGKRLETYFSPDDGVEDEVVRLLRSATKSIFFMAYSFTSDRIADAMLERYRAGVEVRGVFEEQQTRSNRGSEYERLREAGLGVYPDGNPDNMHHKVIIIDDRIVLTGSYNFTFNAENNNDENLLAIHDHELSSRYLVEFEKVFRQANP